MIPFKMSKQHYIQWEVGCLLEVIVNPPLEVHAPRYGWIYNILFNALENRKQNEVTIGYFPNCTCLDFLGIVVSLLGQWGKLMPYKYLYYVLQLMIFVGSLKNLFISPLGVMMQFVVCWTEIQLLRKWFMLRNDIWMLIERCVFKCIIWNNVNDLHFHSSGLLAWFGISKITFFYFENMSNISYIILPLSLLKQCQKIYILFLCY